MEGYPSWTKERSAARLRKQLSVMFVGSSPTPSMRAWWNADTGDLKSPAARRASSNLAARTSGKVEPGASVAAQFPKISKEVNSKENIDRRTAIRRNRISLLPLFYLDV